MAHFNLSLAGLFNQPRRHAMKSSEPIAEITVDTACGEGPSVVRGQTAEGAESLLRGLRFSLVGAGRVGSSLSRWLLARGAKMMSVLGREPGREGRNLAAGLDVPFYCLGQQAAELGDSPPQGAGPIPQLWLIAVADGALETVAHTLARDLDARGGGVALHCSGSHGGEVLAPLRSVGFEVGAWHPLRAFPRVLADVSLARRTWFAIDGDPGARELAHRLSKGLGGMPFELASEDRPLYHFAATLAAGGVATLLALIEEIVERRGLPRELLDAYLGLARGALDQVECLDSASLAITGPVARGDVTTVAGHRLALEKLDPDLLPFVDALTAATRRQVGRVEDPLSTGAGETSKRGRS